MWGDSHPNRNIVTMFSFSLHYCAIVAKKEANENQYTSNYYHSYYICTTIVLTLFATYVLILGSGTSFHYHSATLYSHITMELLPMQNNGILEIIMQNNGILKTLK